MKLRVKTNIGKTADKSKNFLEMFSKKDGEDKKVFSLNPSKPSKEKDLKDKKDRPSLNPKKPDSKEKQKSYSLDLRARRKTKDGK